MLKLPRFKAAAVQASPVYLNAGATADEAASLVREAAANGARLVAFPEVSVPGYPYWNWITDPVVFDLRVDRRPLAPLGLADGEGDAAEQGFTPIPLRSE